MLNPYFRGFLIAVGHKYYVKLGRTSLGMNSVVRQRQSSIMQLVYAIKRDNVIIFSDNFFHNVRLGAYIGYAPADIFIIRANAHRAQHAALIMSWPANSC